MKILLCILSVVVVQVLSDGMFDLLEKFNELPGIPQSIPVLDSEGMANVKNIVSQVSDISNNFNESIRTKIADLIKESREAIESIPNDVDENGSSLSIAIQGAKRALGGVEDNVLNQLMDNVEQLNLAVVNLNHTATSTFASAELQIQIATHPMEEYVQSRLWVLDPESDIYLCLKKVKDDLNEREKVVSANVSSCISEKVDQGKVATSNIESLVDDSRSTIHKYLGLVKECVSDLTSESTKEEKENASSCLVTNCAKIASREFTASIQIATQTSLNLEAMRNAETSIHECIPDDLMQNLFDFEEVKNAADACMP